LACDHIPGVGRPPGIRPAADVGVLILIAELESQVVDDVADILHNISALTEITDSCLAAQILELDDVVGVGCGRETGQNALLGQQEGPSADRKQCALPAWVRLLKF